MKMRNGKWKMENEKWKMRNEKWELGLAQVTRIMIECA